ncbi:MAG: helix-turn-helix transcriptional regulator [Gemmatimonadaceae bacterium]
MCPRVMRIFFIRAVCERRGSCTIRHRMGCVTRRSLVALSGPSTCPARLVRPDVESRIEIESSADGPMIIIRAVRRPPPSALLSRLSPREREVATLVARGLTNSGISRELGIQTSTVKDHVHEILQHLGSECE